MLTTLLVVYRPGWVATFNDALFARSLNLATTNADSLIQVTDYHSAIVYAGGVA